MSHQDDIKAIVTSVGGAANIKSLTHCATRLRFELNDAGKVDNAALDANKLVLGAVPQSGDRYQVVIGGQVASVYEQIMHLPEMAGLGAGTVDDDADEPTDAEVKAAARSKARGKVAWLDSFFEYLADSFRPILGVLLGASIIIALVNLCISLGLIPNDTATTGLVFVQAIWKGVFYFLPIMVAYNAAKKLKVDPWLGGAIMGMLMTPQFASLSDTKTWGDAVKCVENTTLGTSSCTATVFGLPMQLSDYSGNVFVPLLMVAVLAVVYHGLKKIIPDSVQMVFLPFFSMIIVGALTAFIIGPIGVCRQRPRRRTRLDEHSRSVHLRHRNPAAVPVPGAAGSALAAERPDDHEHQHPGLRLHSGPDGRVELRLLRCHCRCAVPLHPRQG